MRDDFAKLGIAVCANGRAEQRAACPRCAKDRVDKALGANVVTGAFHCFRCEWRGCVGVACLRCAERGYIDEAGFHCERCGNHGSVGTTVRPSASEPEIDDPTAREQKRERLAALWRRTVPLRGTLGERYLRFRRCVLPPPGSHLRFLSGNGRYPPSLCALVTDAVTAEPMTAHFTKLRDDGLGKRGTDLDKTLMTGLPKAGGVIRLWPDEAVTGGLGVGEGIETMFSAAHGYTPVWSCIDGGNLATLPVLAGIEALVIFADNDPPGLKAAHECAQRWADADRDVRLVIPPLGDVNDLVMTA